jgi:hypothetical protein
MKYPEELETDVVSELASYIERWYPTEELRIHETETFHFAYWDKSQRSVCPEFLDHIQQAGIGFSTQEKRPSRDVAPVASGWNVANTNRKRTTTSPSFRRNQMTLMRGVQSPTYGIRTRISITG